MIDGDHQDQHRLAAQHLAQSGEHSGKGHGVQRAVHSDRPSGKAFLFVLCACGAELAFPAAGHRAAPAPEDRFLETAEDLQALPETDHPAG